MSHRVQAPRPGGLAPWGVRVTTAILFDLDDTLVVEDTIGMSSLGPR
jgi:hypothetical protein